MTPQQINTAIFTELVAKWGNTTPVAYPNTQFNPAISAPLGEWIRPVILMGESVPGEPVQGGVGLRSGVFMVSVFTGVNIGNGRAMTLADLVESIFNMKTIGTAGSGVMFFLPSTEPKGIDENKYYHVMVKIPFKTMINE